MQQRERTDGALNRSHVLVRSGLNRRQSPGPFIADVAVAVPDSGTIEAVLVVALPAVLAAFPATLSFLLLRSIMMNDQAATRGITVRLASKCALGRVSIDLSRGRSSSVDVYECMRIVMRKIKKLKRKGNRRKECDVLCVCLEK